jgi:calcium/calmodulin-dependent 3',5'-cyclic nucleotide phosphodiesterase
MLLSGTQAGGYLTELQIYSLLIAAICHDVDHRGRGNMFEVHARTKIATTYHDKSVLEQHHAAIAFFTLQEQDCNIFKALSREAFNQARKMIISSILGTDMSKHLLMLENMGTRFKDLNEKPFGTLDKDIEKIAQLIMHAGDLSHPCKSYRIYQVWSVLVCQEFSDQYKEEVKLGLPITEFMKDLDKPRVYYANELGFLNFVVKPLWECVNIFLSPDTEILIDKLNLNINTMKSKLEEWKKAEG